MSPFAIFTIVLIIIYIVYYSVLISRDLYGKKNAIKSDDEEFDIGFLQDEETAVGVMESENGFSLNSSQTNSGVAETVVTTASTTSAIPDSTDSSMSSVPPAAGTTNPTEPVSASGGGESAAQKKIDKVQEEMEEIEPIGNLTMSKEFFRDLLLQANREGSLFVQKTHVPTL